MLGLISDVRSIFKIRDLILSHVLVTDLVDVYNSLLMFDSCEKET